MRILFLCGSLQEGRDGVGDYTRKLAGELLRQNHQVSIIALRDKYATSESQEMQYDEDSEINVLRLPSAWKVRKRFKRARTFTSHFAPDLISLQYVPYAFEKRGMPVFLGKKLSKFYPSAKKHIMVHEPYIASGDSGWKNALVQRLQIFSLQNLKKQWPQATIHTSIPRYHSLLEQISIESKILGLFGNIRILSPSSYKKKDVLMNDRLKAVYFGSAPSEENYSVFADKIRGFFSESDLKLQMIICGRSGARGQKFADYISNNTKVTDCVVTVMGELETQELSSLFSSVDFAIARIPPTFLGKSGSVIAMLEHGLPLWVALQDGSSIQEHLSFRSELCFTELAELKAASRQACYARLAEIAHKFLTDIED